MKIRCYLADFHGIIELCYSNAHTFTRSIACALTRSRVVVLLGPRQCGKTTLARQFVQADSANYLTIWKTRPASCSWNSP